MDQYFSQHGEDRWIDEHVTLPSVGVAVEVGCGDPVRFSNTYWLEKRAWNCVLIEADPRNIPALNVARRGMVIHAAAVGPGQPHSVTLYQSPNTLLSSTRPGAKGEPVIVRAATLADLLDARNIDQVDVLSVDTEGTELDVLAGADLEWFRPTVLIVEYATRDLPDAAEAVMKSMAGSPYRLAHKTEGNLIFVRT